MLWGQLKLVAVATLAIGIASGGAGVYISGSQEPGPMDEPMQATSKPAPETAPRASLRARQLAARKAKASYELARWSRELAEIAVEEYLEVIHPQELTTVEGEVKLTESDLAHAKDRVSWAEKMFRKSYLARAQLVAEELNFQKARFALEQAQNSRIVLELYTKDKTVQELKRAVEKARSDERIKEEAWERAKGIARDR